MEIDAVNFARETTQSKSVDTLETNKDVKLNQQVDFSHEHANGRMFEQAVQNANKTHETSAPVETVRYSDSRINAESKARSDKPLTLNDKDPMFVNAFTDNDEEEDFITGEETIIEALKVRRIKFTRLSKLSRDLIMLNGQKIDEHMKSKAQPDKRSLNNEGINLSSAKPSISFTNKSSEIEKIGEITYHDIIKIEDELGNQLDQTLVQNLNQIAFGKEIAIRLLEE